jgi:gas vesicle protein
MSDDKRSSKFGIGVLVGTLLGGLAALFLSPASGEENREIVAKKVKQLEKLLGDAELDKKLKGIFGETTEEIKTVYLQAKKEVIKKLAALKEAVESIDRTKYEKVVHETVDILKKEVKREGHEMEKLKAELLKEWKKLEPKTTRKSKV